MEEREKKYNIQKDIRTLLGRDCEVKMMTMFLKETDVRGNINLMNLV